MAIDFERGDPNAPKGHALLYFRSSLNPEEILGTYVICFPISFDVAKYVPPFLMGQVSGIDPKDLSALAYPPAPEKLDGHSALVKLAASREDDVLFCGTLDPSDVPAGMMAVNDAVREYNEKYGSFALSAASDETLAEPGTPGFAVNEVLYGLMSDNDKLGELTRLVGRLRFAAEGMEEGLVAETERDIMALAQHLPENHRVPRLIEEAKTKGEDGARLADLYLQRCFHLTQEEYVKLGQVEEQISDLEARNSSP